MILKEQIVIFCRNYKEIKKSYFLRVLFCYALYIWELAGSQRFLIKQTNIDWKERKCWKRDIQWKTKLRDREKIK